MKSFVIKDNFVFRKIICSYLHEQICLQMPFFYKIESYNLVIEL
jgi:hypothetical protein